MAVSYICGFEMGATNEARQVLGTGTSIQSTTTRSGGFALRSNPVGPTGAWLVFGRRAAGGTQPNIMQSARFYFRVGALPLVGSSAILAFDTSAGVLLQYLDLNTNGTLALVNNAGSVVATSTNALSVDGLWHRVELDCGYSGGVGMRVFVDGTQWAAASSAAITQAPRVRVGEAGGRVADYFYDDVVLYDSALPATLNDYNVDLLLPTADSAIGGWHTDTGGGGGTSNLFDAVNNRPPVGDTTANATATTQISSATNSSSDNYDATCAAYTSITGLTAGTQVLAVQAVCNDAQEVTTGSPKAGAIVIASNPTGQTEQSFDYGLPNGTGGSTTAAAVGVFPAGWGTHTGPVTETPTVTVGSGPVARVGKRTATSRVVDADFLGVYVMWEAGAAPSERPRWLREQTPRRRPNRPARSNRGMAV